MVDIVLSLFYRWKNWGMAGLANLPRRWFSMPLLWPEPWFPKVAAGRGGVGMVRGNTFLLNELRLSLRRCCLLLREEDEKRSLVIEPDGQIQVQFVSSWWLKQKPMITTAWSMPGSAKHFPSSMIRQPPNLKGKYCTSTFWSDSLTAADPLVTGVVSGGSGLLLQEQGFLMAGPDGTLLPILTSEFTWGKVKTFVTLLADGSFPSSCPYIISLLPSSCWLKLHMIAFLPY